MVLKAVASALCCVEQSWRLPIMDRKSGSLLWLFIKNQNQTNREKVSLGDKKQNIVQPAHPDCHHKAEHFSQLVPSGSVFAVHHSLLVPFQGLLNPLFLVVSLTRPGVPCQVHKHSFWCLASSHGRDVSALPCFAFLHSCSNFTLLFASQGEVYKEDCRRL